MRGAGKGRKVLVACLGNPDRGDDRLGPAVAHLLEGKLSANATIIVRSGDMLLLIEDFSGFDVVLCVDAAAPMGAPGRIHRLTADELPREFLLTSTHGFGLADAIELARTLDRAPAEIAVYAIEGCCFDAGAPMTPAVAAAAEETARRIAGEVGRLAAEPSMTFTEAAEGELRQGCSASC
ncbi:MAG: hydrogenase maturation protease [Rhodomicrobium sp.]